MDYDWILLCIALLLYLHHSFTQFLAITAPAINLHNPFLPAYLPASLPPSSLPDYFARSLPAFLISNIHMEAPLLRELTHIHIYIRLKDAHSLTHSLTHS
eukprot:GHVU01196137.1.p2 GENE.GHVU01196137.1~~GHVU01196137.1.p2  ORF type:complete len:100 (-),score=0.74 GHVU01196137.1:876-1175(-)